MNILTLAVKNARLTISVMLFFLIVGAMSYVSIPKEAEPDIKIPIIYVSLAYQGISPEDSERLLLRPVETKVKTIKNIKEIRSSAYQGGGFVLIEFQAGADLSGALEDVRAKVSDAKRELPQGAEEPGITEVNISEFPILVATLSGTAPEPVLTRAARELRDRIEDTVPTVLEAKLQGARDDLVEVIIDPVKLSSYNLRLDQLIGGVGANNQLVAAGTLRGDQGQYAVKIPALIETVEDIANLPIAASGNAVVRARDLATIRSTFTDAETMTRFNGKPAIAIEVSKRTGANLIETVDAVKVVAAEFQKSLPAGVEITFSQDKSINIRQMLHDLQNSVLTAVILVFIVILYSLGFRSSLFIGMAIPVSFLMGIMWLQLTGLTVNLVVLFSLILAVGMLVDDAIIVTEYADRRMAEGADKRAAYAEAAQRMTGPVIASTMTRIAAFSPLLFWPGIVGDFMKYMPITLIATLTSSLIYALLFAPTLGSIMGAAPAEEEKKDGWYMAVVKQAVRFPLVVLLLAVGLLVGVFTYYGKHNAGVEFFPNVEPEYGLLYVHARGNLSLAEKDAIVTKAEERILGWPGIDTVYTRVGKAPGGGGGQEVAEDVIGVIQYEFLNWRARKNANDILADLRVVMAGIPGASVEVSVPAAGPPTGKPVQVKLSAADPTGLDDAARQVAETLRDMPEIVDLNDGLPPPGIDWELEVNRTEAAKYGIGPGQVGTVVQLVTNGLKLSDYRPAGADDAVDIRLRLPEYRRTLSTLDELRVETAYGAVPISNFVTREPALSLGVLNRVDGERTIVVQSNVREGEQDSVVQAKVTAAMEQMQLPENISWRMGGSDEESKEAADFLTKAFGAAIFLIFVVLLAQFNKFTSVFLVLSAVVMSTVGVLLGLLIMNQPFSIVMSGIGTIALAGVVVNNNIVLIDTYDHLREQGWDKLEAVLETCRERARPVVLTAVTAILGVLPIAFGVNLELMTQEVTIGAPSTQWWIALSSAIVFGLAFSTVLTLIVTPSALMVFTRANPNPARRSLLDRLLRRNRPARAQAAANVPPPAPVLPEAYPAPATLATQPVRPAAANDSPAPGEVTSWPKAAE